MADREAVDAEGLFCSCPAGRRARELRMTRLLSWSKWIETTNAANAQRSEQRQRSVFESAGIPPRFAELTVNGFRLLAGRDDGKKDALQAALALGLDGFIEDAGRKKRSLLVWSNQRGVGKTGLVTPVFQQLLRKGKTGIWISWQQLVEQVKAGYKDDSAYDKLRASRDVDVLLLDDLGFQWADPEEISSHTLMVLNSVIFHRHAWDKTTLMTSNLSPDELMAQLRPEHWQRIAEMARVVEMRGEVLRPV